MLSSTEPAGAGLCAHGWSRACGSGLCPGALLPTHFAVFTAVEPLCFRAFITLVPEITF